MEKRKILLVTSHFPPYPGGMSRYHYDLCMALPVASIDILTLPYLGDKEFDLESELHIIRLRRAAWFQSFRQGAKLISIPFLSYLLAHANEYDFILCGGASHQMLIPAYLIWKIFRIPYCTIVHGLDFMHVQKIPFYASIFNYMVQTSTLIYANSTRTAEEVRSTISKDLHIVTLNPSVDKNRFMNLNHRTIIDLQEKYRLQNKKVILTVGTLVKRKGHEVIIDALPLIINEIPDIHYLIVGKGSEEVNLKMKVSNLGLKDFVTFTDFIPDSELPEYYGVCDVFAMISHDIPEKGDIEGFGIVYLEAGAAMRPVVAGRSGGVEDAVEDGVSGLLVDPTNVDAVAQALIRVLKDKKLAQHLGEQGYARVQKHFTREKLAAHFLNAIAEAKLLNGPEIISHDSS